MSSGEPQAGFTYLVALLAVAVAGTALVAIGEFWSQARKREKEAELLWVGNQFKQAIGLYYHRSPGGVNRYPEKLDDLVEDRRFLTVQRYLRRIYADPMTGKAEWGLIAAPEGGIMGVHSMAKGRPLLRREEANSYAEWKFFYAPSALTPPHPATKP
jgi:hypothetical protein